MAEIRAAASAATTGNFAGIGSPTPCSPLVFDASTGELYVLLAGDVVTKIGQVAAGADMVLTQRGFGPHVFTPGAVLGDSQAILAGQVFRTGNKSVATWGA